MPSCAISKRTTSLIKQDALCQNEGGNQSKVQGKSQPILRRSNNDLFVSSFLYLTIGVILLLPLITVNVAVCALTVPTENNDVINSILGDGNPSNNPSDVFFPGEDDSDNEDTSEEDEIQNTDDYHTLRNEPIEYQDDIKDLISAKRAGMNTMYLRSGRAANMLLRAGKRSNQPMGNILPDEDAYVDNKVDEKIKRAQSMLLRAGKRSGSSMLLRAGRSPMLLRAGRSPMLLRAGRAAAGNMLLRAGKRAAGTMYLRAGKRFDDSNLCLHLDCSLLAHALQEDEIFPKIKKAGNSMLLRAGKRGRGNMYLRAGKRSTDRHEEIKKAGSMYLRAGKRSGEPDSVKRAGTSMLLRAGKRGGNSMLLRAGKRAKQSMYLRSGK